MHSYNNPFTEKKRKTLLWRVHLKTIVTNTFNTKISTNVKQFLKQCIVLTIPLPRDPEKYCHGECI